MFNRSPAKGTAAHIGAGRRSLTMTMTMTNVPVGELALTPFRT